MLTLFNNNFYPKCENLDDVCGGQMLPLKDAPEILARACSGKMAPEKRLKTLIKVLIEMFK